MSVPLRSVQVFKWGRWVTVRLNTVQAGDKVQINAEGTIITGFAVTDGFSEDKANDIGGVQLVTNYHSEKVGGSK